MDLLSMGASALGHSLDAQPFSGEKVEELKDNKP